MARTQDPSRPTGAHWGEHSSAGELPNVSGSPVQTSHLDLGDVATVDGALHVCASPKAGGAVWSELATVDAVAAAVAAAVAKVAQPKRKPPKRTPKVSKRGGGMPKAS